MKKPKSKDRDSHLTVASSVLQSILSNVQSPLADQFIRWKLYRYWNDIVGESIANQAVPVEVHRDRLLIYVSSSTVMHEMHFMANALAQKVNAYLGYPKIKSVKFTVESRRVPDPKAFESEP